MNKTHPSYYLVIGLGASGISMAKFLRTMGETVIATDINASRQDIAPELNALGIQTEIGFHDQKTFDNARIMVPSPGIPLTHKYIRAAAEKGVPVTGELDIFTRYNTLPVIAITGTNGKTTTTTLIGDMLKACGRTPFVGGNIGTPLMEHLMDKGSTDVIVAEISSFQLDLSHQFKPDVGVLLNISEDHLDRYENFAGYEASKWGMFRRQNASDTAVINPSIKGFDGAVKKIESKICTFSSTRTAEKSCGARIDSQKIDITFNGEHYRIETAHLTSLKGTHNHENISAAVLACLALGADITGIVTGLAAFKNLSHRMEFVKTVQGVSFYNDSKATNTDAVIRALECFDKNIILILGGREKGTDFSLLAPSVKQRVNTIIAMGESKQHIQETFTDVCRVLEALTMKDAVQQAFASAGKNGIVLLSPACASFDMYDNYAHRGNDFITHVNALGTP